MKVESGNTQLSLKRKPGAGGQSLVVLVYGFAAVIIFGAVLKLTVPSYFVGNTLSGVGFGVSGKTEVAVLIIERKGDIIVAPATDDKIQTGDVLIVGGNVDKLEELFTKASRAKTERK